MRTLNVSIFLTKYKKKTCDITINYYIARPWMKEKLDMHPLFRPMTEEELNSDVCVELLRRGTPTEEGQKVKRNSGSTWLHCYVRVHGNPRY